MPSDPVRRRVIYSGRVQGVGFRFTAASIAKRYPVAGYVRNLRDGTVELVLEGSSANVDAVLAQIADAFSGHIEGCRASEFTEAEQFTSFSVRH
jgi:acylphosphatase